MANLHGKPQFYDQRAGSSESGLTGGIAQLSVHTVSADLPSPAISTEDELRLQLAEANEKYTQLV